MTSNPYMTFPVHQDQSLNEKPGPDVQPVGHPKAPDAKTAAAVSASNQGSIQGHTEPATLDAQSTAKPKSKKDDIRKGIMDFGNQAKTLGTNIWGHLSTGNSTLHTTVGKLQNYRMLTPGGAQSFWRESFQPSSYDILFDYFACHLSTSTGPVAGTLFIATQSLSFLSDRPLAYTSSPGQTSWSMYKVSIPTEKVSAINAPSSPIKPTDKFIQVVTVDRHEFWFLGFINHSKAFELMQKVKNHPPPPPNSNSSQQYATGAPSSQGNYPNPASNAPGQAPGYPQPPQAPGYPQPPQAPGYPQPPQAQGAPIGQSGTYPQQPQYPESQGGVEQRGNSPYQGSQQSNQNLYPPISGSGQN